MEFLMCSQYALKNIWAKITEFAKVDIIELRKYKGVEIIEGHLMSDHMLMELVKSQYIKLYIMMKIKR